ncbi:hypothetical protein IMG5_103120 [Ichthyophthirius multifiliis]|uniref:Uncharacterized protein n=1 Tax=Ichthyophthirius multifiliis TaxID=5932 RepID=G0QSR9_ICHMU|nr:hypothetical protein IMG5_103120 [Ichthyophthirius multifiliis]EGR31738.1 hypothetical protein IMG5_103120 [Ichthyophthirius multifiliis]|eukprot:XP_004035224.1 hypothetical protein IMG5_103120 [Ichthyophthirius multifiliis]
MYFLEQYHIPLSKIYASIYQEQKFEQTYIKSQHIQIIRISPLLIMTQDFSAYPKAVEYCDYILLKNFIFFLLNKQSFQIYDFFSVDEWKSKLNIFSNFIFIVQFILSEYRHIKYLKKETPDQQRIVSNKFITKECIWLNPKQKMLCKHYSSRDNRSSKYFVFCVKFSYFSRRKYI